MKTKILSTVFAITCFAASVFAQSPVEAAPDTLLKVDKPSRLVVTESAQGSLITVTGIGEDGTFHATVKTDYPKNSSISSRQSVKPSSPIQLPGMKNRNRGWQCYVDGITLGLNNPMGIQPEGGLQWSKSLEIGWLECLAVGYAWGETGVSLGLGFDWRNYKITTTDKYLTVNSDKVIEWAPATSLPEGSNLKNSRLMVFSLQLPLLFRTKIPNTCLGVKAGPIFNFNTHASLKTNYTDAAGNNCELFREKLGQRRFTLDFFGSISICNVVGVFVRYSPMKVMNTAEGLNFHPLTLGLAIGI